MKSPRQIRQSIHTFKKARSPLLINHGEWILKSAMWLTGVCASPGSQNHDKPLRKWQLLHPQWCSQAHFTQALPTPRHTQLLNAFPSLQNIIPSSSSWFNPIITGAANNPEWLPAGFWEHCSEAFLRARLFQAPSSWYTPLALLQSPPSRQWSHESDFIRLRFYPQWFVANSLSPQVVGLIKSWRRFPLPNSVIMDTFKTTWFSHPKVSASHNRMRFILKLMQWSLDSCPIFICLVYSYLYDLVYFGWLEIEPSALRVLGKRYCCITTPGLFLTFYYTLSLSCSA